MSGPPPASSYDEEVEVIRQGFEYEMCEECGGDFDDHVIAPDMFGHAHAWCRRAPAPQAGNA